MPLVTQALAMIFVFSTMLGVGLTLRLSEISGSLQDRGWLARALLANFVMLPAVAFGVARLLQLDPALTAGLLILATAPGGPVLIKLAALAKGDHALTVGLLVTLLVLGVFTQPLILPMLLQAVSVDSTTIVLTLIVSVLAPLLSGMALCARKPLMAQAWHRAAQRISTLSMLLICIILPIAHWQELQEISGSGAFRAAALFLLLACLGGWLLGGPHPGPRRILSINCALPNLAAAVVIASQNFSDPRVVLMLLVILLVSIPFVVPLCLLFARQQREITR